MVFGAVWGLKLGLEGFRVVLGLRVGFGSVQGWFRLGLGLR